MSYPPDRVVSVLCGMSFVYSVCFSVSLESQTYPGPELHGGMAIHKTKRKKKRITNKSGHTPAIRHNEGVARPTYFVREFECRYIPPPFPQSHPNGVGYQHCRHRHHPHLFRHQASRGSVVSSSCVVCACICAPALLIFVFVDKRAIVCSFRVVYV